MKLDMKWMREPIMKAGKIWTEINAGNDSEIGADVIGNRCGKRYHSRR
ncbi:hypothetical protein [Hungatella hathewayi]|nr:hypothetical protein [Hungatella hathewayi]